MVLTGIALSLYPLFLLVLNISVNTVVNFNVSFNWIKYSVSHLSLIIDENIKYDLSVEDIIYQLEKEGIYDPSPDEIENKLAEIEQSLPTSFKMAFTCDPEYLEDFITDELKLIELEPIL